MTLSEPQYLALLDWTGRQLRRDKRGAIPAELAPIMERLSVNGLRNGAIHLLSTRRLKLGSLRLGLITSRT